MKNILNKSARSIAQQSGLSLVELMISITLGLVIMAGVLQLYASASRNASNSQGLSRIQENIRYAVTRLGNDIARAGNMGCFSFAAVGSPSVSGNGEASDDGVAVLNKSIVSYLDNRFEIRVNQARDGVEVWNAGEVVAGGDDTAWHDFENFFISGDDEDSVADGDVLDGTDTLIVKYVDTSSTIAIDGIPDNTSFTLADVSDLKDGDVAFAGNCNKFYTFILSQVEDGNNDISIANGFTHDLIMDGFSKFYTGDSGAYRYYVGGVGCTANGLGRANCSLFRSRNGNEGEPLVQGVHGFEVMYGYENNLTNTVQINGGLTVDRVQVTLDFNVMDSGTLLTKTITHVFAVRNQL